MLAADVVAELKGIFGSDRVLTAAADLAVYAYDATPLFYRPPDAVVFARAREEVQALLRLASRVRFPVIPRGAATNLSAGVVPLEGGVILDLNRMNRIMEIDTENLTATLEPGVVTANLHAAVEGRGLFYPPDPGSMKVSTMGGNVAECAGGMRGLKYGTTKHYVIGLEAVLASGDLLVTGGKLHKDVAGYDLTPLLVGSEGTLAVITRITVKLLPLPETKGTLLATFDDIRSAATAVSKVIAARILPATMEFLDNATIRAVIADARLPLPADAAALLLIEQDGSPEVVRRDMDRIAVLCREQGARALELAATPEEGAALMAARRAALPALARLSPTTVLEDATVPRSRLADMVEAIAEIAARHRLRIATFGHAGDGNLHPTCLTDERNREEIARAEVAFKEIFEAAIAMGGTITGEHGVGAAKAAFLEGRVGPVGLEAMRAVKAALDPQGILNPGKLFPRAERRRMVVRSHAG